jgi:hypothetical protein
MKKAAAIALISILSGATLGYSLPIDQGLHDTKIATLAQPEAVEFLPMSDILAQAGCTKEHLRETIASGADQTLSWQQMPAPALSVAGIDRASCDRF